ncbi:hypothetical protein BH11PLA1_BH11PLA1_12790 [soil metagenome]
MSEAPLENSPRPGDASPPAIAPVPEVPAAEKALPPSIAAQVQPAALAAASAPDANPTSIATARAHAREADANSYTQPGRRAYIEEPALIDRLGVLINRVWIYAASDTIPVMAAALAYRTIFSLIPLLGIGLLALRLFGNSEDIVKKALSSIVTATGLNNLAEPSSTTKDGAVATSFKLDTWLEQTSTGIFSSISFTLIGIVSAALLIYAAIGLLVEVEKSFNSIFAVQRGRSWSARIMQYWLIVTLGPLFVYASFYVGEKASSLAIDAGGDGLLKSWLVSISGYAVSVFVTGMLLTLLYLTVPNTRVRWRPALIAGLTAAAFFELAKYGFKIYVKESLAHSIYNALALLPLFMFWVYITWLIILLGLRLAYLIQHRGGSFMFVAARLGGAPMSEDVCIEPASAASIGLLIARRFESGSGPIPADEVVRRTGLDQLFVLRVLQECEAAGLFVHVTPTPVAAGKTSSDGYALAKSPASIRVAELIRVGQSLARVPRGAEDSALAQHARDAQVEALGEYSLADALRARSASDALVEHPETRKADAGSRPRPSAANSGESRSILPTFISTWSQSGAPLPSASPRRTPDGRPSNPLDTSLAPDTAPPPAPSL